MFFRFQRFQFGLSSQSGRNRHDAGLHDLYDSLITKCEVGKITAMGNGGEYLCVAHVGAMA
jgi:hypothetical protein